MAFEAMKKVENPLPKEKGLNKTLSEIQRLKEVSVDATAKSSNGGFDYLVENEDGKRFCQNESEIFMNKSSAYAEILANIKHRMDIAKKDYNWEKQSYKSVKNKLLQSQKGEYNACFKKKLSQILF